MKRSGLCLTFDMDQLESTGDLSLLQTVQGRGVAVDLNEGMLVVALGRGRLPGILDITARHPFVVFGTMDGSVLAGLTASVVNRMASGLPVYFYETG